MFEDWDFSPSESESVSSNVKGGGFFAFILRIRMLGCSTRRPRASLEGRKRRAQADHPPWHHAEQSEDSDQVFLGMSREAIHVLVTIRERSERKMRVAVQSLEKAQDEAIETMKMRDDMRLELAQRADKARELSSRLGSAKGRLEGLCTDLDREWLECESLRSKLSVLEEEQMKAAREFVPKVSLFDDEISRGKALLSLERSERVRLQALVSASPAKREEEAAALEAEELEQAIADEEREQALLEENLDEFGMALGQAKSWVDDLERRLQEEWQGLAEATGANDAALIESKVIPLKAEHQRALSRAEQLVADIEVLTAHKLVLDEHLMALTSRAALVESSVTRWSVKASAALGGFANFTPGLDTNRPSPRMSSACSVAKKLHFEEREDSPSLSQERE